jgi:hypothetical protein
MATSKRMKPTCQTSVFLLPGFVPLPVDDPSFVVLFSSAQVHPLVSIVDFVSS